jgi:predicted TPR repeat methyltransferase
MAGELPDDKAARVDWVIRAPDNAEMQRRYDIWAAAYDSDVGSAEDYLAPMEVAKVAGTVLQRSARVMDAGAGTGLLGAALQALGFRNLVAVDYSAEMLKIARGKGIYASLHVCDLGQPTDFAAGSFDAVVSCGTTSQMPSVSLREFVRLLRPGGKIVFGVIPDAWASCGWAAILKEFETDGTVALITRSAPFQMMPTTEPDFICEVWVISVS